MKRDMDLIRSILRSIEAQPHANIDMRQLEIEGHSSEEVAFHCYLIWQAGFAIGEETTNQDSLSPSAILFKLTWDGHDFVAASSDSKLWELAKKHVIEPTGGVAFAVLLAWLKAHAKEKLGLPP